jgi:putative spermidine/putrescine transport system substrate-binding protein
VNGHSRRRFLTGIAAAAGALTAGAGRAGAARETFAGTIRVLGLGYDMPDQISKRAEQELGFGIVSTAGFSADIQRLVTQEPATWDIFSCFQQDVAEFWPTHNLQPVEIARIRRWKDITPLYKRGRARPAKPWPYGQGDAAFRRLYVDPSQSARWRSAPGVPASVKRELVQWVNESTGKQVGPEPKFCTGVPGTFNFDSFGYNSGVLKKQPETLSWAELLNGRWKGRVGLNTFDPQGGLQDMANAVQAARLMRFGDLGDPTRKEIDSLVKLLLSYKKRGHFFDVWPQGGGNPVDWMLNKKVVLCTMWAAQIASLSAAGFPVRQADPPEGYRAFGGLLSISKAVTDPAKLDACYDFLNWWHSGFAGAVLLREGYYNAVQSTIRQHMTPGEYAYWMDGKPADRAYPGPFGDTSVAKGRVRDGGSFISRASRISSWNSIPRQQKYFIGRWAEFIASFSPPGR